MADHYRVRDRALTFYPGTVTVTGGSSMNYRVGRDGAADGTLAVGSSLAIPVSADVWSSGAFTEFDFTELSPLVVSSSVPGSRVAMIGDSITIGSTTTNQAVRDDPLSYAHLLTDAKFVYQRNAGVTGENATQMLARIQTDIIAYAPDWCLIMAGTNDASQGRTQAQYISDMTGMVTALKAAGIRPVLCTSPPNPSGTQRVAAEKYAHWVRYYAATQRIPLVDVRAAMMDQTTGGYKAAYDSGDGIHPNAVGRQFLGQLIANVMSPLLPGWSPPLATMATVDSQNLIPNALFLTDTNLDGVPDSWTKTGLATVSIVAGAGSDVGSWLRILDTVNQFTQVTTANFAGASWAVGDRIAFCGRAKATNTSGQTYCQLAFTGGTPANIRPVGALTAVTLAPHTFYQEYVVPAGTTAINAGIFAQSGTGMDFQVAQLTALNLTKLGIA